MIPDDRIVDLSTLTTSECILLAQQLLDRVFEETPPLTEDQLDELQRRADAADAGELIGTPLDEVIARLRRS